MADSSQNRNFKRDMTVLSDNESTNGEPAKKVVRREEEPVSSAESAERAEELELELKKEREERKEEREKEKEKEKTSEEGGPILSCDQVMEILKNSVHQRRNAFESVRRLTTSDNAQNGKIDEVINCGLIPELVQGLIIDDEKIQSDCASAIVNITAGTTEQTEKVVEAGAIAPLIKLMMHTNLDMAEDATWAVHNITRKSPKLRDMVIQSNGVEVLMHLCGKIDELPASFQRVLAKAFYQMCKHTGSQASLKVIQVLAQGLLQLIQIDDCDVRHDTCFALCSITFGSEDQNMLVRDSGFLPHIYKQLISENDDLVSPALIALGNIASYNDNDSLSQSVINLGALRVLPEVARKTKDSEIVENCCMLIRNVMAGTEQQRQAVIDNELLSMIVTNMKTGDKDCQLHCSGALSNLTEGNTASQILSLLKEKPFPSLAAGLTHTDSDVLSNVLEVIYSLLTTVAKVRPNETDAVKKEVEELGVIGHLEKLEENKEEKVRNLSKKILSELFA